MTTTQTHIPGRAIKAAREYVGLTQGAFAEQLTTETGKHWSRQMVTKVERGGKVVDVVTLRAVVALTGFPMEFFVYGPSATVRGSAEHTLDSAMPD